MTGRMRRALVLAAACAVVAALPGCIVIRGDKPPSWLPAGLVPTATPVPAKATNQPAADPGVSALKAYLVKGGRLTSVARGGKAATASPSRAMEALLAGPTAAERAAGISSALPAGTRVNEVTVDFAQVARLDLSSQFAAGGSDASVRARVAQVVYTLTQVPGITGVLIRIDGKRVEHFGRERIDLLRPQTRGDYADIGPAG